MPAEIYRDLTMLDDWLVAALQAGDIRLLRATWLIAQPDSYRLESRQMLEIREQEGGALTPFLSPKSAAALLRRGDRSAAALTYPWITVTHPDPIGSRLRVMRNALILYDYIEALFWCVSPCDTVVRFS